MSEDFDDIVDNLREPDSWVRVVFMVAFAIVLYVILAPLILVLMVAQALFVIITGKDNPNLKYLGASLTEYVTQILKFITYNSELKPFPFSSFPGVDKEPKSKNPAAMQEKAARQAEVKESDDATSSEKKKPAAKKTTKKKSPAKKKPSKKNTEKIEDKEGRSEDDPG